MDAASHRKISDAIDDRLTRVDAVFARVAGQKFDLNVLTFCHYILSAIPDAAFIELHVSDQGGDDMVFRHVGVPQDAYDAWTDDRSYVEVAHPTKPGMTTTDLELIDVTPDGTKLTSKIPYVRMDETYDVFNTINEDGSVLLTEDAVSTYAMALQDYELSGQPFWEQTGNRNSGTGRLWISRALATMERTYEGFIKGTLDPMPDPQDKVALAEWLASETAPTGEQAGAPTTLTVEINDDGTTHTRI